MFSFYETGFKQDRFDKTITIEEVTKMIIDHPQKELICQLHKEKYKSDTYVKIKESLPCITPGGLFGKKRKVEELVRVSEYLFFDIDDVEENIIESYKQELIGKYRDLICMIGRSSGGRGLFFYLHVQGLREDNYESVRDYYIEEVFTDINIDRNAKGMNRAHIIAYDPNLYYNGDICLEIPEFKYSDKKERQSAYKKKEKICYTRNDTFIPISDLMKKIVWQTEIEVTEDLFIIDPIEFHKLYIPETIVDGAKHKAFRGIVSTLVALNPGISLHETQSFINYVNENRTTKKMERKEMMRTVEDAYQKALSDDYFVGRVKCVHFNKQANLNGRQKSSMASRINGLIRRIRTSDKIVKAKQELQSKGKKITKAAVAKIACVSKKTVMRNWEENPENLLEQIMEMNRRISFDDSDIQILNETENEYED